MGYLNLVDSFVYKEPVFRAKLDALAENDAHLKDNGWNTNTKTLFYQSAVPTGWTKDTSQNDKFLRVVSATGGGSGGTKAPSSTITLQHNHTMPTESAHTHQFTSHSHGGRFSTDGITNNGTGGGFGGIGNNDLRNMTTSGGSSTAMASTTTSSTVSDQDDSSSSGSHSHTVDNALTDTTFAYCDIIIGTKDTSSGYTDLTDEFHSGDIINFNPFQELADNDDYNYDRLMPATTVMIFSQASAPTGWTKLTTTNDKGLRVVSGTGGGTGGSTGLSSGLTLAHAHTTSSAGGHTHTTGAHRHDLASWGNQNATNAVGRAYLSPNGANTITVTDGTAVSRTILKGRTAKDGNGVTTSNPGDHSHSMFTSLSNVTLAYLDVIQCSKDSVGAPYSYEDVTSGVFEFKRLVSKQKLNKLAKNDEHILFHTTPAGSQAFFFMTSAPITWTKLTTQNDKALRIVSGASGGSAGGGAHALSASVTLAHTHTIISEQHNHTASHGHSHDSRTESNAGNNATIASLTVYALMNSLNNPPAMVAGNTGFDLPGIREGFSNATGTLDTKTHSHGGVTNSGLSDIAFAYADVIWCTKD
jgi:hypothetical protein